MALRDNLPPQLAQELACGMSVAFGVVSLGVWGLMAFGWHLGPTHALQRTVLSHLPGHAQPAATVPVAALPAPNVAAALAKAADTTHDPAKAPSAELEAREGETPTARVDASASVATAERPRVRGASRPTVAPASAPSGAGIRS